MIGGAILVIGIGLWKWNNFVKKQDLEKKNRNMNKEAI